jgi:predicted nucleic acid-binding protein
MKTNVGFWDTSAVVPLCVRQDSSQNFGRLWRKTERVVVWWGTPIEIRSALNRLYREKFIDARGLQFSVARLDAMRRKWREITPNEKVRNLAESLPDAFNLRALDSFQLAAALVWCNGNPKGRLFVCDDVKLAQAAQKAGFSIKP